MCSKLRVAFLEKMLEGPGIEIQWSAKMGRSIERMESNRRTNNNCKSLIERIKSK